MTEDNCFQIDKDKWKTTKELIEYVKTKHNRHWTRFYVYTLLSRNCFQRQKLGHMNLYNRGDVDKYIKWLRRPSSSGVREKKYDFKHTGPLIISKK